MALRTLVRPSPTADPGSELDERIRTEAALSSAPTTMLATAARRSSSLGSTHCEYILPLLNSP